MSNKPTQHVDGQVTTMTPEAWDDLNVASFPKDIAELYTTSREDAQRAKASRVAFESAVSKRLASRVPAGHSLAYSYRTGTPRIAAVPAKSGKSGNGGITL